MNGISKLKRTLAAAALALLAASCSKKEQPPQPAAPVKPAQPATTTTAPKIEPPPIQEPAPVQPAKPVVVSTLAAYFHFDEDRSAKAVVDSTPRKLTARINDGVAAGVPGYVKNALDFTAKKTGQVTLFDPLDFVSSTATAVAWVKRRGPQANNAALFFARGGESSAGILTDPRGQLSYVWGRERTSEGWVSGLVLPDNAWVFVALVVEPDKATLYLGVPGESLWSAENARPHAPADFAGALTLGRDPILDSTFEGALDEFGIWKNSMTRDEIEKLFAVGQKLAAAQTTPTAPKTAVQPKPIAEPGTVTATVTASGWNKAEFERAARLYNSSVAAFQKFLQTRQNGAGLKQIEADVRSCADTFEQLKTGAPATLDLQTYVDRCNKLNFDIHAAKTLAP